MSSATDCPTCHDCGLSCASFLPARDHGFRDGRIMCAACGYSWWPTDEETAQANAADRAYLSEIGATDD